MQVLYGAVCTGPFSTLARFESKPDRAAIGLAELAGAALDISGAQQVGIVCVAESAGLVGASLRRAPVNGNGDAAPFRHPEIRQWLSFTTEPAYSRALAVVAGVAARSSSGALGELLRPMAGTGSVWGHFHAAAFSYRPMKKGRIDLKTIVRSIFEAETLQGVLHLIADDRDPDPTSSKANSCAGRAGSVLSGRGSMSLLIGSLTIGFILSLLALGVFPQLPDFRFSDITAEGSITLGAAVAATAAGGWLQPARWQRSAAFGAGMIAGRNHRSAPRRFNINGLLAGILVMTALYSVNLHVMGKSNTPLLTAKHLRHVRREGGGGRAGRGPGVAGCVFLGLGESAPGMPPVFIFVILAIVGCQYPLSAVCVLPNGSRHRHAGDR